VAPAVLDPEHLQGVHARNSAAGIAALDAFTTLTGWSVF
jgi:hypothetical protein